MKNEFDIIIDEISYKYTDFDEPSKREIWNLELTFNVVYEYFDEQLKDEQLIKWFFLLNYSGTPADKNHMEFLTN